MVQLEDVYGFAIDLAFRCNAASDLLLQTSPTDRIGQEGRTELTSTQGSGSFMKFTSDQLDTEQMVMMMDAIRICFVDNQNHILALAKLNTSNYNEEEGAVSAPLYLYDYTISNDGSISMGERREDDSVVTSLQKDVATVITTVVWLDGDHIDNSSAAITAQSMSGMLNLQFASSADLVASDIGIQP